MAAQDQMDAPVAISRHRRAPADGSTGRPADRGPVDRRQPGSHPSDRRRPGERRPAGRRPAPQVRLPEPRRRSVLRIRDWRVRTKLAVVLVVPSLALLMVAGVQIRTLVDEATRLGDFAAQVELTDRVSALVHEVQAERDRTVGELAEFEAGERPGDPGQLSAQLRSQRAAVDRAAAAVRARGGDVAGDTAWRAAYGRAVARLDGLRSVRDGVADGSLPRRAAHDVYGRTVDALLALMAAPAPGAGNADLDRLRAGYVELSRTKEVGSQLRASIFAVAAAQGFAPGDYIEIADLRAQQLAAVVRFRSVASASQIDQYDQVLAGRALELTGQLEQAVIDSAGRSDFRLDAPNWWAASTAQHDLVRKAEAALLADAATRAAQRSADQWSRTWLVVGGIAGALLIALIISIAIGRSMARSLRVLRREALTVAQVELPQVLDQLSDIRRRTPDIEVRPPSVRSADEIGEVADAFTAVHSSAVSLAIEQAAMRRNVNTMFINLARRSQVLVERQLELLDDLEREEQDPDLLENLFKLDHLAARMRRNDESLLVLAGNDNARRWSAPVAPSAAVLAAIAEIEQYTRVRHTADDSLFVVGHAVADLVHLLAELLENATIFSPPGTTVEVVGRVQGGRVLIEIADEGMGMSERALEEANALLAEPPAADVAASERMGLFVVSHLAARHGVSVHLRPAAQGLVASVSLPSSLLAPPPEEAPDGPPAPAADTAPVLVPEGGPRAIEAAPPGQPRRPAGGLPPLPPMQLDLKFALRPNAVGASPVRAISAGPAGGPTGTAGSAGSTGTAGTAGTAGSTGSAERATGGPAGRRVVQATVSRPRRGGGDRGQAAGSAWWSRSAATGPPSGGAALPAPPAVPVTGGTNERGLPVRVPMAQLPTDGSAAPVGAAAPAVGAPPARDEPDPDAVSSTLARFYSGVRRAEGEEGDAETAVHAGPRREEPQ